MKIKQVITTFNTLGNCQLLWKLSEYSGAPEFYVEWARAGSEWTELAGPLLGCTYLDTVKRDFGKVADTFYRIRMEVGGNISYSDAVAALGPWNREDFRTAKEICRKETLVIKRMGRKGLFMRRRDWGDKCPVCRDFDTSEPTQSRCTTCYGTGFVGGYWPPIYMPVLFTKPGDSTTTLTENKNFTQPTIREIRVVAWPRVDTQDMWFDLEADERYVIKVVTAVAEVRNIPIIQHLVIEQLPKSDIVYTQAFSTAVVTEPVANNGWTNRNCLDF